MRLCHHDRYCKCVNLSDGLSNCYVAVAVSTAGRLKEMDGGRLNGGRRLGSINGCSVRARLLSEDRLSGDLHRFVNVNVNIPIVVLINRVSF